MLGRLAGEEYSLKRTEDRVVYSGPDFCFTFSPHDPEGTLKGEAEGEVDFGPYYLMDLFGRTLLDPAQVNYLQCLLEPDA